MLKADMYSQQMEKGTIAAKWITAPGPGSFFRIFLIGKQSVNLFLIDQLQEILVFPSVGIAVPFFSNANNAKTSFGKKLQT
jgi:hypothetical protein